MTQEVRVNVELRFEGKPAGAQDGGLLNIIRRDIEVDCMPGDIPEFFSIDVTNLGLDESIHASDLKLPDTVKMVTEETATLVTCAAAREEAPAETGEAAAAIPAEGEAPAASEAPPAGGEDKE